MPEELQYLVVSHAHFDHVCGNPGLKKAFPNLQVVASEAAARGLVKKRWSQVFSVRMLPWPKNLGDKGQVKQAVSKPEPPVTINVDRVISEGSKLDLGRGTILYFSLLPGHSPCSMTAYLPLEQVLFTADCGGYPISEVLENYKIGRSQDEISQGLFQRFYRGGLANYSTGNIRVCTDLLVRRTIEAENLCQQE